MKQKITTLIVFISALVFLTGCTRSITYDTMKNMVDNKKSFIVEIVQDDCSHCEKFAPVFEEFTKEYKIAYYKINLSNMDDNNYSKLDSNYSIKGTPTVIFIKDGKELTDYRITGEKSKKELLTIFKQAGYIK